VRTIIAKAIRTIVGEQRHHEGDGLSRSGQAVKCGFFGGAKRPVALGGEEALVLARVDANIALADLASGWTRQIMYYPQSG
jgi:hypothetical protein